jgi:hypothetical protein
MSKYITLSIIFGALFAGPNVAVSQKTGDPTSPGMLFRITGEGLTRPSYVFGTVHLACPGEMFNAKKLGAYVAETERVVLEMDMDDPAEIARATAGLALPNGGSFKTAMTPEQYAKVGELVRSTIGVEADQVQNLSPIALQVLVLSSAKFLGCSPPSSYESLLVKIAGENKLPVEGLESAAFQAELMQKIPLELQAKMLYEMAADPDRTMDQFSQLMKAYKAQNAELLYDITSAQLTGGIGMQEALVDKRNADWLLKIEDLIKARSSFVAVGGGHLGGKKGLISLLRERGYKVSAVKL